MDKIIFYGASWCPDCFRSKKVLDDNKVEYEYIDIDLVDGAADKVAEINKGMKSIPTIVFPDSTILVEPGDKELYEKLTQITHA
ncbi:MAG: glutaredoxin domain-containing protein [bacterium]